MLTEQVKSFLQKVSLSSRDTDKVLRELDKDEQKAKSSSREVLQNLRNEITDISAKLDKLLSAYLDEIVSAEEYAAQKEKLLARKVECTEEISEIESGSVSWLEPARALVKSLNHATELVQSGDKSEMTTFLKQIGSIHILFDKSISFSPKIPYKLAAERSEATNSHLQFPFWRKGRDSNSRGVLSPATLAVWCLQPLGHLSIVSSFLDRCFPKIRLLKPFGSPSDSPWDTGMLSQPKRHFKSPKASYFFSNHA